MPEPDLNLGFFGKLPSAGDFVTRGLPPAFVKPWDRWVTRHLVGRLAPEAPPLYFHRPGPPAFAGVVVASQDSAGRAFPLTLAARCAVHEPRAGREGDDALAPCVPSGHALAPLTDLGRRAVARSLTPDALAAELAGLALSPVASARDFLLWIDPAAARAVDPEAPGPVLDDLLGAPAEPG